MTAAFAVGMLVTGGVYLIAQRGLIRVIIGFVLLGHAVNVLLLASGGMDRRKPPIGATDPVRTADPFPQAFALTSIVISFGITIYLLGLAWAGERESERSDPEIWDPPDGDRS